MWHRTAMQQPAGAKRDLHMHAWLESVQAGQMSPAGRSTGPVARYRLVNAWPSKVAAGLARAESGTTVAMETITLEIGRASWRERVGQYVEISVAAGSLKKNIQINH